MSDAYMNIIQGVSSARLQYEAEQYLRDLQTLNSPTAFMSHGVKISTQALAAIGAGRSAVSQAFSSMAAKSSIIHELPNMEALLYEGWAHLKLLEECWIKPSTLLGMEREIRTFLENMREYQAENAEEIMYFSLKSARAFALQP